MHAAAQAARHEDLVRARHDHRVDIRQPLDNLNEAGSLYGAIIYQKAPIIMRHLEALLGEDSFRDGLREYLNAHKFGNATWDLFVSEPERRDAPSGASSRPVSRSRPAPSGGEDFDDSDGLSRIGR